MWIVNHLATYYLGADILVSHSQHEWQVFLLPFSMNNELFQCTHRKGHHLDLVIIPSLCRIYFLLSRKWAHYLLHSFLLLTSFPYDSTYSISSEIHLRPPCQCLFWFGFVLFLCCLFSIWFKLIASENLVFKYRDSWLFFLKK